MTPPKEQPAEGKLPFEFPLDLPPEAAEEMALPYYPVKAYPYPAWWWWFIFKGIVEVDDTSTTITNHAAVYREKYVYHYFLSKRRFWVSRLTGSMATRPYFQAELKKRGVVYVTGLGHGSPTKFTGYYGAVLWEVGNYASREVNNRIIHLLSCLTARQLGPDIVSNGAKAFFGYSENFTITWDHPDAFWKCDSLIDRLFADGLTADSVYKHVYEKYTDAINYWLSIHTPTAAWLMWDRNALKAPYVHPMFGDGSARL